MNEEQSFEIFKIAVNKILNKQDINNSNGELTPNNVRRITLLHADLINLWLDLQEDL